MTQERNERMRFSVYDDLVLLRTVLSLNPYENTKKWKIVEENVLRVTSKNFSSRTIKEHVDHLINLYNKNDTHNLRKSGSEEQFLKKQKFLQEIKLLKEEFAKRRHVKKRHNDVEMRDAICSTIKIKSQDESDSENANVFEFIEINPTPSENPTTSSTGTYLSEETSAPSSPAPLATSSSDDKVVQRLIVTGPDDVVELVPHVAGPNNLKPQENTNFSPDCSKDKYLCDKELKERELALQERKMALEERKLKLEEEKFQLQAQEIQAKLEMDRIKLEMEKKTQEQQQKIIDILLQKFNQNDEK